MNIIIADDHNLFREMCQEYLVRKRPNINIFAAEDLDGAIEVLEGGNYIDLIILDFCMPGMDGANTVRELCNKYPDIPLAVISGVARKNNVEECIDAGARGFLPKTLPAKALVSAMELILSGEIFMPVDYKNPPELKEKEASSEDIMNALEREGINLTRREKEILGFLVKGATNQTIADELGLKLVTVKLHVKCACRKLGVDNRTQAALKAREFGFK